jgi:vacuolar protein sorting-associated protein 11
LTALTAIESGPNLSSVRHYFTQIFQSQGEIMAQDEVKAEKFRAETETLKKNIHALNNEPVEFRGSLCDACHQPLSLPALFFLCKHSFHQECIRSYSETEKDCMVCRKKNMNLQDVMHKQNETRNQNNKFQEQLENSHEPFTVIADFYGRGLFNKIVLLSDDDEDARETQVDFNIPKKQIQKPTLSDAMKKTEGQVRVEEMLRTNVGHKPQPSESRMRLLEQSYRAKPTVTPATTPQVQQVKKKIEVKPKPPVTYPISANPFDDDDDTNPFGSDDVTYDDSKNPFSDEAGELSLDICQRFLTNIASNSVRVSNFPLSTHRRRARRRC